VVSAVAVSSATLSFHAGTIEVRGLDEATRATLDEKRIAAWDPRSACVRAEAMSYAPLVLELRRLGIKYDDGARAYEELAQTSRVHRAPRPYQTEALAAWKQARGRGVVVLPTGAGKTHVATMAIDDKKRATLVVAPTLDLVRQWYDLLRTTYACEVGVVGGGEHRVRPLTVTTYDSAFVQMEHFGARFGLIVFDECHHLPGPSYSIAARQCLAPYRLGLTATPERADGRDAALTELIGAIVYRQNITALSGDYLAEYETETIEVELSATERLEYDAERALYKEFLAANDIRIGSPSGWQDFIIRSSRTDEGRRAMQAYRRQRALAFTAASKLELLEHLLHQHRRDRALVFTQDNDTAYAIARRFLVPAITHQTKVTERSAILAALAEGTIGAIVTSKVLNEGVDVPDANVAIVLSGSGSVREHVQRLGRVLRKRGDKRAVLYELVTSATGETYTSERRREHDAYR
jgi:superfamily II DNA or RNA helicase